MISSCFVVELFLSKPSILGILSSFVPTLNNQSVKIALGILGVSVLSLSLSLFQFH
jgi:Mn2+/Fe2+ NRAMP family transporter